jgi:hypothetical protein
MKYITTTDEVQQFELLKHGSEWPFEIVNSETAIAPQNAGKIRGCDQTELRVKFFTDATFTKPVGMWTENLTFPHDGTDADTAQFLRGMINAFIKCTGIASGPGVEVDLSPKSVTGLRGWAKVKVRRYERKGEEKGKGTGEANQVSNWLTDREKFPRNTPPAVESDPFA